MSVAVKALVWLPILNCMSLLSGVLVARSESPVALTKVPLGLQMPTRTPGVLFASWNRRMVCSTLARVGAFRGLLAVPPLDPQAEAARAPTKTMAPSPRPLLRPARFIDSLLPEPIRHRAI